MVLAGGLGGAGGVAAATQPPFREFRRGGMLYRRLGQTDLFVSTLSFGSHTNPAYRVAAERGTALNEDGQALRDRHIAKAFDRGVNMVDVYENAGQWQPMAQTVRGRRDKVLVSICRQFSQFAGRHIDAAAGLFGHVDLYRIALNPGPDIDEKTFEDWDAIRRAKRMGKVRAIGVSLHDERKMVSCLKELEGLDFIMFPYNFIHARADYSEFLPKAIEQGVGLIAIKPLAAGSIAKLDPMARPGSTPEDPRVRLYKRGNRPVHPAVVEKLTRSLNRIPGESLCQAALRFVYSKPFITSAMPGMFQEQELDDNYDAISRHLELSHRLSHTELNVLAAAQDLSRARGPGWLPSHYRWLDRCWRT